MGIFIDRTGERFNRLVVLECAGRDKHNRAMWKCRCDCGNETIVMGTALRRGDIKSCGCISNIVEMIGETYGRLQVIEFAGSNSQGAAMWKCLCECGTTCVVNGIDLRRESTKSCGCISNIVEMIGETYGRLQVIEFAGTNAQGRAMWKCLCECGTTCVIRGTMLRGGNTRSCGCYAQDQSTTHGMTKTREYSSWRGMKERCYNMNNVAFKHYGGRGITICERWVKSFENFLEDMGERPEGKTLDRIDNNGNYEPGNCRWATPSQQANNQRRHNAIQDEEDSDEQAEG